MTINIVAAFFNEDATKGIFAFDDGAKVYWGEDLESVVRFESGGCELLTSKTIDGNFYADKIEAYDGGAYTEENMQGWHHAEWRRAMRRARA